jgi:K+-sensing histidine kinase KdpD
MSFALSKKMPQDIRPAEDPSSAFYSQLAEGLHAMAQPLTIVRGALGALTLRKGIAPPQERYVRMSTEQVERLCDLMSGLQDLLDATQFDAECVSLDLWEIVDLVLGDLDPVLRQSGAQISAVVPNERIYVIGDSTRTEKALRAALKTAASLSSQGDLIQLEVFINDGVADLIVQNRKRHGKGLGSPERFNLALVQANIRCQAGVYECFEDPLHLSIKLPLQGTEDAGAEVALHGSLLQQVNE